METAGDMDYQGWLAADPDVALELLTVASASGIDLEGDQWPGAITQAVAADSTALQTSGIDLNAAAAIMDSNDVLGKSDGAALVVLQSAILNVDEGDGDALQQSLAQHSDALDGYLAVINDYDAVDDSQMVAMMQTLNLGGQDFELVDTVLQGNDVSGMVASLDLSHLEDVGSEGVLNITSLVSDDDVAGTWGVQNALDVINTAGAASIVAVEALEGIASALGADGANQLDVGALATIASNVNYLEDLDFRSFSIGALINLDLGDAGLLTDDIVGLANTADLDLLSFLPDANLNDILNVPLEDLQGNRVLTKEHLEEVVLDPTGFKPFTLDTPFESGFLLQHIEGNLA